MSFANLSIPAVLGGMAALAGALYLLHRLRVRHRPVTVVTTLFWREAVEETRARVLVHRFRHFWAYVFALVIACALWLAIAEPRPGGEPDRDTVVLLDASAAMAVGDRLGATRDALFDFVESGVDVAQVIVCGAEPMTVLNRGEDILLLTRRLAALTPDACPPTYPRVVREHVRSGYDRPIDFVLFSDVGVDPALSKILPDDIALTRRSAAGVPASLANRAITALGADVAASGAWDRADVFVEIRGAGGIAPDDRPAIEATLDGEPFTDGAVFSLEDGRLQLVFRDAPARGGVFAVALVGSDDNALDDRASIVLPNRPLLRVALTPSLESVLRPVLEADPGVVIADGEADVSMHRAGEAGVPQVPALVFVAEDAQDEAFLVSYTDDVADEVALARAFAELGLEHIDTQSLAEESARPIRLGVLPGARRSVLLWASLLSPRFDFVDSRAFPIFVARSLRFLASVEPIVSFAASGEPIADAIARRFAGEDPSLDPVRASFVPSRAGAYQDEDGKTLWVSLSDLTTVTARSAASDAGATSRESGFPAWSWIGLLALGLIVVEWFAYRTGRMP